MKIYNILMCRIIKIKFKKKGINMKINKLSPN